MTYLKKNLTFYYRGVWTTKKAHIIKVWMDIEQHIPKPMQKGQ